MNILRFVILIVGALTIQPAYSQIGVYTDMSATKLVLPAGTNILYGPTIGLYAALGNRYHVTLSGDVRAGFYGDSQHFDSVAVGPRVSTSVKRFAPYGEFMLGFARYNDGLGTPSSAYTNSEIQLNAGVDRRMTKRFDWRVFDFGYTRFQTVSAQFHPTTYSTGIVFRIGGRI
jgi:hypothetical protein